MKTNQYLEELRSQSVADLNAQLVEAKKELFNLRFQNATNQLTNTSRVGREGERRLWKKEILEKHVQVLL